MLDIDGGTAATGSKMLDMEMRMLLEFKTYPYNHPTLSYVAKPARSYRYVHKSVRVCVRACALRACACVVRVGVWGRPSSTLPCKRRLKVNSTGSLTLHCKQRFKHWCIWYRLSARLCLSGELEASLNILPISFFYRSWVGQPRGNGDLHET